MRFGLGLGILVGVILPSLCYGITVGQLREDCLASEHDRPLPALTCLAFIDGFVTGHTYGIADAATRLNIPTGEGLFSLCPPASVGPKQLAAEFVKWANENPQEWHKNAGTGLWQSLYLRWPCK